MLALLLGPAWAAEHVVTTGAAADSLVNRVADTAGVAPDSLHRFDLGDWLSTGGVRLVGPGRLLPCTGSPMTASAFSAAVDDAAGAIDYAESQAALSTLEGALAGAGCLTEPVPTDAVARAAYLQGIAHLQLDASTDAAAAFRRALVIDLELAWDDVYPPNGLDLFEAAQTELGATQQATLRLLTPVGAPAWMNGQALAQPLTSETRLGGWHLLQVGTPDTESAWIQLQAGATTTIIWPALLSHGPDEWLATDEGRATLDALLVVALGAEENVHLPLDDTLWRTTLGSGEWSQERLKRGAPRVESGPAGGERADRVRWVTWTGAGITGVAGSVALASLIQASAAANEVNDPVDGASQQAAYSRFQTTDKRWVLSRSVALGGAAILGTGLILRW